MYLIEVGFFFWLPANTIIIIPITDKFIGNRSRFTRAHHYDPSGSVVTRIPYDIDIYSMHRLPLCDTI